MSNHNGKHAPNAPAASQSLQQPAPEAWEVKHVQVNLDAEMACSALGECLVLLENSLNPLAQSLESWQHISSQVRLRISYALLHGLAPQFSDSKLRLLAQYSHQHAQAILRSQHLLRSSRLG